MSTPNLGETPNSDLRDAVHFPVIPCTALDRLLPGDFVRVEGGPYARVAPDGESIGIVDPFRVNPVDPGEKFWLLMRKIDGQPRHSWSSPDFPDELEESYNEGVADGQCCYGGG